MGRFLTRDTWEGDFNRPSSLNKWGYVEGNPINATDPSGYITEKESERAGLILEKLSTIYGVRIERDWGWGWYHRQDFNPFNQTPFSTVVLTCWTEGNWRDLDELEWTFEGVKKMANKLGGADKFRSALAERPITFRRMSEDLHQGTYVAWTVLDIKFYNETFNHGDLFASGTVVHELAHVWDTRQGIFQLSSGMNSQTKSFKTVCEQGPTRGVHPCYWVYDKNNQEPPPNSYATSPEAVSGPREDFADTFAICVYPNYKGMSSLNNYPIRKNYIQGLINGNKCS
jgi:hypothetical protein